MKYIDIRTFLNHYLPRRISTDMQSLIRGLEPDSAIMRAIDTRRPRELTDNQKASVEEVSELKEPTTLSIKVEWTRRNEAVEAVRIYCDILEGGPRRGRQYTKQATFTRNRTIMRNISFRNVTGALSLSTEERTSSAEAPTRENTKQFEFFQCYGMKHYSRQKHLLRYFRDSHLNDRQYNQCNEAVEDEMCLRRYAQDRHGLKT
ncbi:hypothetical protein N7462_000180 [Penicillium macrosclerotiorum]|uniref:uncharacterized protein n=1 Tax=Penicillium macrosclerotiorum TaxID=303699 RepID=UPI002547BA4E|nr:uncharacterized protein N7462_000180 [Penicillium macrosclerotiorum]KAJ5698175.1 hypothetical protein N7462_000180 [Penicillium macrosclerotiorum]